MTELAWTKSSYSNGDEHSTCVEVAITPQATAIRDSKAPASGQLAVPHPTWRALLAHLA
jgi:uncharacterized protein DUF397